MLVPPHVVQAVNPAMASCSAVQDSSSAVAAESENREHDDPGCSNEENVSRMS